MTSASDNRDRGLDVEDESLLCPLDQTDDDRQDDWYDLVATDSFNIAARSVDAADPIECICPVWFAREFGGRGDILEAIDERERELGINDLEENTEIGHRMIRHHECHCTQDNPESD